MADQRSNLPVEDISDGTPGSAVPSLATQVAGSDGTDLRTIKTDTSGQVIVSSIANPLPVGTNSIGQVTANAGTNLNTSLLALQSGAKSHLDNNITGTITALNGNVAVPTNGMASVILTVTGTWVATLTFQGFDGTNWITTTGLTQPSGGITTALASNGTVLINSGGYAQIRIIATAFTSGTANIFMNAGVGTSLVQIYNDSGDAIIIAGGGTAGSSGTSVLTVQGISGGTNLPVSQTTAANLQTTARLNDGSGNSISSYNSQLEVTNILNVSSQYRAQSITTTAAEALGGATILSNRQLLHITPTNGTIHWGYSNTVTTTTGTPLFPNNTLWLSVGSNTHVYVIAAATTDSRIGELS